MAEAATEDVPQPQPSRFGEYIESSAKMRRENGVEEMSEEEAMAFALEEVRKARQERKARNSSAS